MEHSLDSSIIANRLRSLREDHKLSRNELVDQLPPIGDKHISAEIIRQYEGFQHPSKKNPANLGMSVKVLHTLADFYKVSTDYILGRTDVKSPDANIQAIVEYTGLTEESIIYLHQLKSGDSQEVLLDNLVSILEHDIMFRIKSDPTHYEMTSEIFDKMCGRTPEKTPDRKRQAQIMAQHKRREYIQGLSIALRKCPIYTLNAINTLISNNNHLHLFEEIGKYISADPDDLNNRYPISVGQTATHYTDSKHVTSDIKELQIARRLSIITEKLKELREIVVSSTE